MLLSLSAFVFFGANFRLSSTRFTGTLIIFTSIIIIIFTNVINDKNLKNYVPPKRKKNNSKTKIKL